jgi:hypothetical protein
MLNPQFAGGNDAIRLDLKQRQITLKPDDCAVLVETEFTPGPGLPIGTRATFNIQAIGFTPSRPQGVELSGVQFEVEVVAAGIQRAYSVGRHGSEGRINLPLNLAGNPTSDPRLMVDEFLVIFNVTVDTEDGKLTPEDVSVTSANGKPIPPYSVQFAGQTDRGKELTIRFSQPLEDQERYRFDFGRFLDTDGEALQGDKDFEVRVLQGDANSSGAVTGTDVSFVRGRINLAVAFGPTSRADVNMTGGTTGPDISFVRARIGHESNIRRG